MVSGSRSAARLTEIVPPDGRLANGGKIGEGEHRQGDVAVPADPGAHLVLVQADLAFGLLEQALNGPSCARNAYHRPGARRCRHG